MNARRQLWTVLTVLVFALSSLSLASVAIDGDQSSTDDGQQHSDALHRRIGKTLQLRSRRDGDNRQAQGASEPSEPANHQVVLAWVAPKQVDTVPPAVAVDRLSDERRTELSIRHSTTARPRGPPSVI